MNNGILTQPESGCEMRVGVQTSSCSARDLFVVFLKLKHIFTNPCYSSLLIFLHTLHRGEC